VAFKESVLSGGEAAEGVTIKPAKVVEAYTPSGCCVVRVKAHALPDSTAALLDGHAALLKELLEQASAGRQRHEEQQQQQQHQQQQSHAGQTAARQQQQQQQQQSRSLDGHDGSREVVKFREAFRNSLNDISNKQLPRFLERAWLLGPKNVGPNVALCSPTAAAAGSSGGSGSSLFDVPAAHVVRAATKHGGPAAAAAKVVPVAAAGCLDSSSDAAALTLETATGAAAAAAAHDPATAANMGTADAAAGAAAGTVAIGSGSSGQQLDVPFGSPVAASIVLLHHPDVAVGPDLPGAAAAAAGVEELWPHITSSVESGVTAGFQLATSAGPLCDESMWGVMFELEVRLMLPAPGQLLDLAEAVYGPFSGQVGPLPGHPSAVIAVLVGQ